MRQWAASHAPTVAARLAGTSAVAIIASDPFHAAELALAIGHQVVEQRRVAIADLVGEIEPLQRLVPDDDHHGIVDSFHYGVSLNRIARGLPDTAGLFILPTGSEIEFLDEVYRSERWRRLASGFREMDALLLLVVDAKASGLPVLFQMLDGVVLVTSDAVPRILGTSLLAVVPPPGAQRIPRAFDDETPTAPAAAPRPVKPGAVPDAAALDPFDESAEQDDLEVVDEGPGAATRPGRRPHVALIAAGVLLALGAVGLLASRRQRPAPVAQLVPPTPVVAAKPDTVIVANDTLPALADPDPADSTNASPWSVEIVATNTVQGAWTRLRATAHPGLAATVAPVMLGGDRARWFKVVLGAYADRHAADSLLAALRANGTLGPGAGVVVRAPFALLVAPDVPSGEVTTRIDALARSGIAAYAMRQVDGAIRLYTGAFETADQAVLLAASVRSAGMTPVLAYRTGSMF